MSDFDLPIGTGVCACTLCGRTFRSVSGFDAHRTGTYDPPARRCLTETEMDAKGMVRTSTGRWVEKAMPQSAILARASSLEGAEPAGVAE